ncbi:MAG: hypothetical protein IJV43_05765 [Oscillospiraceae bacterium]|nr:hypothetical protein [Oscillospiraceae bacterium]MBQ9720265.1 hypothetical protein [Oscillospiraceae bacterium]
MSGSDSVPALLLPYVKAQLGVTWDDAATDERYLDLIADGMSYIDNKLGVPGDYHSPGGARELVKEYVRYARDAALDVFETNYTARILALQNDRRVSEYANQVESSVSGEG